MLTALDRCDGCSARALTVATKEGRTDLLLCGHHTKTNAAALRTQGWTLTITEVDDDMVTALNAATQEA